MQGKGVLVLLLVIHLIFHPTAYGSSLLERCEGVNKFDAFSNDINACLFTAWTTASGSKTAVLSEKVKCPGGSNKGLCYGPKPPKAQFAVCYSTETLIPHYTGHIVAPNVKSGGGREGWHNDNGKYAPKPGSSFEDYSPYDQKGLYPNYDPQKERFLSKGHYTPNADFDSSEKIQREMTMVNTNIAPQWQAFNAMNWALLEDAIRKYATSVGRNIYVFTGTGGFARNIKTGDKILLKKRVVTPRYYWKAICDPGVGSVVFMGVNNVGEISDAKVKGCKGKEQTKKYGIITCYSLDDAKKAHKASDFMLPPFNAKCKPDKMATFINLDDLK